MFSALKKLTKISDDRCPAPIPMSSSLQKKFSRGVHFNVKILIKGDRNVGKSCLLQRLQGGPFIEEYVPTDQIQVAPIHWSYKNTDHIVKVEVWEVVDKGRTKKKAPLGLKLENQLTPSADDGNDTPVLDATFLDVYKNATGVILMLDITKPWTFEYVVKELSQAPADLPVIILGNHCDMQHHRQVHPHHIDEALHQAKLIRTAPVRYAESSMRNGFGLRLLHKFLGVPFLRLQKTSLLDQLQRNRKDMEEIEKELDDFQRSEECEYNTFVDRLANKRRESGAGASGAESRVTCDRSPSIVLGAGKPIVPPDVNPLQLAQSLNPKGIKAQYPITPQKQYTRPESVNNKYTASSDLTPAKPTGDSDLGPSSGVGAGVGAGAAASDGDLDEFYAGALDSSFLEDLSPLPNANQELKYEYESDSDEEDNTTNPRVTIEQDDLDIEYSPPTQFISTYKSKQELKRTNREDPNTGRVDILKNMTKDEDIDVLVNDIGDVSILETKPHSQLTMDSDFPLWAGDSSARRSPEGGEDPDVAKEAAEKAEKKHKKKKSKDKDKGDYNEKSERKEKKQKHKKSKSDKNTQQDLLVSTSTGEFNYQEYDSI